MSKARDIADLLPIQSSDIKSALNASGSAKIYACRAWVQADGLCDGTCTIRGSGNITSVVEDDTARYTISFDDDMPHNNYCVTQAAGRLYNTTGGEEDDNVNFNPLTYNVGYVRGYTSYTDSKTKVANLNIAIFC